MIPKKDKGKLKAIIDDVQKMRAAHHFQPWYESQALDLLIEKLEVALK